MQILDSSGIGFVSFEMPCYCMCIRVIRTGIALLCSGNLLAI